MMWYSVDENPLTWERDFAKMESSAMRMLRVLHFSPFASENPLEFRKLGMNVLEGRPEAFLRKTDAIVQLAQKHGVVLFLTLHDWMPVELSDEELDLQRRWARFWADRYRDVPGIIYDVQNEPSVGGRAGVKGNGWHDTKPLAQNMARIDTLNRWIKANVEGVKQGDPEALVTVGFLQMIEPADRLLGARHVDFNNMHFHSAVPDFAAEMKINDRRFEGKSFSLGEFGARESHDARTHGHDGTMPEESIARFLTMIHESFGMGASFALNWDWKDFDGCVFPWGLNHACDLADKRLLPAYRNISLFLERLRPRYRDPGVYLLVPDSHRLGAEGQRVHAAVRAAISGLFSTHTDFNVINEFDLDRLPAECRTIVWPVPYCPTDEAFAKVVEFVRGGGRLYISGDLAYLPDRERTRTARFAELGLIDPGEHTPLEKIPTDRAIDVQTAALAAGKVFYVPSPIELDGGPIVETLREFLDFAGEERIKVDPDDPDVYVFHVPLADGAATVLSNRAQTGKTIQLADGQLTIAAKSTGLLAVDRQGQVTSVECTGRSTSNGTPDHLGKRPRDARLARWPRHSPQPTPHPPADYSRYAQDPHRSKVERPDRPNWPIRRIEVGNPEDNPAGNPIGNPYHRTGRRRGPVDIDSALAAVILDLDNVRLATLSNNARRHARNEQTVMSMTNGATSLPWTAVLLSALAFPGRNCSAEDRAATISNDRLRVTLATPSGLLAVDDLRVGRPLGPVCSIARGSG